MKSLAKKTSATSRGEITPAARPPAEPLIFRVSTEVLLNIFRFLDKCSCSRVALSCKRFKEPALDQLWREITTLAAPLGLLDELINTGSGLTFRNGLGRADWSKYWSCAHRIRRVHITDEAGGRAARVQINPQALFHAFIAATSRIGHGALLPTARALAFDFHQASDPSLVLPLIGPTVRHITIKVPQPSEQINQAASVVFSTLTSMSCALKLEHFDITIGDDVTRWTDSRKTLDSNIANFVASQPTLECLQIRPVNSLYSLTQAIQGLRCLRVLKITCTPSSRDLPPNDIISSLALCTNLEQLRVQGPTLRSQHDFSLIQPLLSCRGLAILDLSWLGAVTLNAANVEEMGRAWVKLESLQFSSVGDVMPVDLLLTFAASFSPSLRYLGVPLDISKAESILPITKEIPPHDLKVLYTGHPVKESDVQPFAELLGTLFRPGFEVIFGVSSVRSNGIKEAASFHEKVNSLLRLIWRVQERTRQKL
ncbi:hypothetical protein M407DRAFT_18717 [Tulasnella calospora MUT 4182]|uniref:F-box domain-containing protein n=1 Tax=Tulasnella calospora MUT 4182 TaxID=1051891 RepID=A0A0C3QTC8_9AGAM|nr:hypothetical protein M407DRAFT_18717 [Tulasnella calospora MUT 4182]